MGVVSAGMCFFCSSHAKSKTTFAPIPTASLVRAWVPDPGIAGPTGNPRRPVFGTGRGLGEPVFATTVRRVQTCRTPTRTATKRRVRPGHAIYSIAWTAEHTLQHRLRKGIWRGLLVGAKCTSPRSGVPMRRAHLRLIK